MSIADRNTLLCGDDLTLLRQYIEDESADSSFGHSRKEFQEFDQHFSARSRPLSSVGSVYLPSEIRACCAAREVIMLDDDYAREFTNTVYNVSSQVARFKAQEPKSVVLAAGATKARRLDEETALRSGLGWATARRTTLILTNDKLVCGSWTIPLASIEKATLVGVRRFVARGLVLKISTTDGGWYQFGLQYDPAWESQTALKLTVEEGKIQRSRLLIVFQAVVVILMLVLILAQFAFCMMVLFSVLSAAALGH